MTEKRVKAWAVVQRRRILCAIFGHQLYVYQEFEHYSRRVKCRSCDGDWGMNDNAPAFIKWDSELEEMHKMLGRRILK